MRWLIPLLLTLAAATAAQPRTPLPADRAAGAAAITEARLREFLGTLASPEFGGRGTGQDGFDKAARYVADHFRTCGLEPLGDEGTYLQRVPWSRISAVADKTRLVAESTVGKVELGVGELAGSVAFRQDASGEAVHVVVTSIDDVQIADEVLKDKVAFVEFPGLDLDAAFAGANRRRWGRFLDQFRTAGATAVLVVDDKRTKSHGGLSGPANAGAGTSPAARASGRNPNEVYLARNTFARLQALAVAGGGEGMIRALAGVTVQVTIELESAPAPAFNVVGRIPGSDPTVAAECVVIGSHLDHLGTSGGVVFPGADDDGSGSSGVMALAEAFSKNPVRPRRSVVLVAFCGEERGLVGSRHFANNPPVPLESMVAELQMDMIGRNEETDTEAADANLNSVHLVGTEKLSRDLHALCLETNTKYGGFDLEWDEEDVFTRSDHANFARKGVPIAFFFTGFHNDYHRPSDTPDKIDYAKMRRIVTWVYALGFELAMRPERPLVDEDLWQKNRESLRASGAPAAPLRRK